MSLASLRNPARPGKRSRTLDDILVAGQRLLMEHPAAALSISQVAAEAGVVQGTFYNYFESVGALVDEVGLLLLTRFAERLRASAVGLEGPAEIFSAKTRQAFRIFAQSPGVGRMLFDIGLPVDRLPRQLKTDLGADITEGFRCGEFRAENRAVAGSVLSGAILGLALDLYRKRLPLSAIEPATAELLLMLGVPRARAKRIAHAEISFCAPMELPLSWQAQSPSIHPTGARKS
jgi:AcrR family transcriptional regulator